MFGLCCPRFTQRAYVPLVWVIVGPVTSTKTTYGLSVCVCGGGGGVLPVNSSSQRSDPAKMEEIVMQAPPEQ